MKVLLEHENDSSKGFFYRKVFCGDEVMKCRALKELNLTAREMLRRKAIKGRVTQTDLEQQPAIARFQRKVRYYERQPAFCSTRVSTELNGSDKRDSAGNNDSGSRKGSSKEPERKWTRKK